MTENKTKVLMGKEVYRLLRQILPENFDLSKAQEWLAEGNFREAIAALQSDLANVRTYAPNPFEANPEEVAERLVGSPIAYLERAGSNICGVVTKASAFHEPRGNCPDLFSAEPGTVDKFYDARRGGFGAILISAHPRGETGVASLEEVAIGNERVAKTRVMELFEIEAQKGSSLYRGDAKIVLAPRASSSLQGNTVAREEKFGGVYFTLRKN